MRISLLAAAAALTIAFAAPPAEALPIDRSLPTAIPNLVEQSQFVFGGRNYCWYNNGWNGPGFYWCGYSFRRGLGWGGRAGWHGWHHTRPPRAHQPPRAHRPAQRTQRPAQRTQRPAQRTQRPAQSQRPRATAPRGNRSPSRSHGR